MYEALVTSAIENAMRAEEVGFGRRPHHPVVQGFRGAGFDRRVPRTGAALRLPVAPWFDGSRHGQQGHCGLDRCIVGLAAGRHRRHDTYFADARAGGDRTREVIVGQEILQTMGLRKFTPMVIACPGCGRTTSTVFSRVGRRDTTFLRDQMPVWKKQYPGVEAMNVAVMGCIVNGRRVQHAKLASACRARASRRRHRYLSMAKKPSRCVREHSRRISCDRAGLRQESLR